ncbi:MAG: MEDS domain-containing protein [Actinomycetota bacterium]|nr:MEDS domain-containing protein [Actinomycetota bacterium]
MRRHGSVASAAGLGVRGHACWIYGDDLEFTSGAYAFLQDGVDLGQRLLYVGSGSVQKLRFDLDGLPDVELLLDDGTLRIMPLELVYDTLGPADPMARLSMYATATETALQDGFTGLRVVGDCTALVGDPEQWEQHVRWEAVAERYMARNPMAALCCYDRRVLPEELLSDLACVHRSSHAPDCTARFRLYAGRDGLGLAGEVDGFSAGDLGRLLRLSAPDRGDVALELDQLEFIDHHGVLAIADHARELGRQGRALKVLGAPRSFDRLAGLLQADL